MGPEVLAFAGVAATKTILESLFNAINDEAGKSGVSYAKSVFKRWQTKKVQEKVLDRSKHLRKVKTIWKIETEVDLVKFYYPSKLKSSTEPTKVVHRLQDFSFDGNLVVRGTVGQGKSTFLRYLAARELELGERIPIFVELRRLKSTQSVADGVLEEMKNLGLEGAEPGQCECRKERLPTHLRRAGRGEDAPHFPLSTASVRDGEGRTRPGASLRFRSSAAAE